MINADTQSKKQSKHKRNTSGLIPFKKGKGAEIDPRINLKGRPKSFDQLRSLAQEIASQDIEIDGSKMSRITSILLELSSDKKHMQSFLEIAFGKVPTPIDLNIHQVLQQRMNELGLTSDDIKQDTLALELFQTAGVSVGDEETRLVSEEENREPTESASS